MAEIEYINQPLIPTHNKVIVRVDYNYNLKESNGGILLSNAAHEDAEADAPGHNLSEWIIRKGTVERMPRTLTRSGYDWEPKNEITEGDVVFWPIFRFFNYPVIRNFNDETFIIVDYHDIYAKKSCEELIPINGYCLFSPVVETAKFLDYEVDKPNPWYIMEKVGDDVVFDNSKFNCEYQWKEKDKCLLSVPPFKMESDVDNEYNYYLAQKRHVLLTV